MRYFVQTSTLLLACALGLAGCENKTPRPKTEAELADKVKTALGPQAQTLDIEANAGVVRIRGQVDSDETKQRVQEATKSVPGVTWVQDQTSVKPEAKK